jgi:hypothetical protein
VPKLIAVTVTTYCLPREDKKIKDERFQLSDGRTVRIETYKDRGTKTVAHYRNTRDPEEAAWYPVSLKEARRMVQDAKAGNMGLWIPSK